MKDNNEISVSYKFRLLGKDGDKNNEIHMKSLSYSSTQLIELRRYR